MTRRAGGPAGPSPRRLCSPRGLCSPRDRPPGWAGLPAVQPRGAGASRAQTGNRSGREGGFRRPGLGPAVYPGGDMPAGLGFSWTDDGADCAGKATGQEKGAGRGGAEPGMLGQERDEVGGCRVVPCGDSGIDGKSEQQTGVGQRLELGRQAEHRLRRGLRHQADGRHQDTHVRAANAPWTARQPNTSPSRVLAGTPTTAETVIPPKTMATARPRRSGPVIVVARVKAVTAHIAAAVPASILATKRTGKYVARAVTPFPAASATDAPQGLVDGTDDSSSW